MGLRGRKWQVTAGHYRALQDTAGHCRTLYDTTGHCRTLHNEKLKGLHCPTVRSRVRRAGNGANLERIKYEYTDGFGKKTVKGTEHLEDVGVDNRIILNWILKQLDGRACNEYI